MAIALDDVANALELKPGALLSLASRPNRLFKYVISFHVHVTVLSERIRGSWNDEHCMLLGTWSRQVS